MFKKKLNDTSSVLSVCALEFDIIILCNKRYGE